MKQRFGLLAVAFLLLITPAQAAEKFINLSTTTSTENSGLLDELLPKFTKDTGIAVRVISKGTGAAIKDGADGNVDAILVHDPKREAKFVKDGLGLKHYYVMYNDFVLIGPKNDPAKVAATKTSADAFSAIAKMKAPFISRGDDSGTHAKEAAIWAKSKTKLSGKYPTDTTWYSSIGQGMGKVILMATERQAYTITDRATFNSMKYATKPSTDLIVVSEGDFDMLNPYGYIPVSKAKHPHVKQDYAVALGDWLVSPKGKDAIRNFTANGKPLFFPDPLPQ